MSTFSFLREVRPRHQSAAFCACCVGLLFALAPHANGELMFFDGNPNGYMPALHDAGLQDRNVLFNDSGQTLPAFTVEGTLNGSTSERVMIGSTTLLNASGGQAPGVSAASGELYDAEFAPNVDNDGVTFRSLSFNIDANGNYNESSPLVFGSSLLSAISTDDFSVTLLDANGDPLLDENGNLVEHSFSVTNGNTFFGVVTTDGIPFSAVSLTSSIALNRITQIRATLADADGVPIEQAIVSTPEPTSIFIWCAIAVLGALAVGCRIAMNR